MNSNLKAKIRAELFRRALAGDFPTYEEFYERASGKKMKGRFPWQTHFDAIAKEERKLGYPDITFIVKSKASNYPSQIDFRSAKPIPNAAQLRSLCKGTDKVIALYCPPGTPNPYWSVSASSHDIIK
ncbi:MAG TPA: hypothetical protein VHU22_06170 [Xanthobacteraceae bacterium]|jgi:hypothetical protein|nr:hypothetical protein [Xanthobacteraceae bacterium]